MSSQPSGVYVRPIQFVDTPIGMPDGSARRLGGGLLWFSALEIEIAGQPVEFVPVSGLTDWLDRAPAAAAASLRIQIEALSRIHAPIQLGERMLRFDTPQVMGILNVTPDSFSDGGQHVDNPGGAADAGFAMMTAGAAIIDVGGESTRPGAKPVWEGDEIARVVPVIERLARSGAMISIDTRKAAVMEVALAAGAHIVNDVSGLLHDPRSVEVVAGAGCPVVLMHAAAHGEDPHAGRVDYGASGAIRSDLLLFDWFQERIAACVQAGIRRDRIIIDPGIGFGKALGDDLAVINRLSRLHALGQPILFGASRKRIIGALSREEKPDQRLGGSIAIATIAAALGAHILRVHDVPETVQALAVWRGLRDAALSGR